MALATDDATRAGRAVLAFACVVASLASATGAAAQEAARTAVSDAWVITLGSWATLEPSFEGARDRKPSWRPIVNFRGAGDKDWIVLPNDGYDLEVIETDNFRAGPVANGRWLRPADGLPSRGFRRIGSVEFSIEAGAFAEYWPADWLRSRVEARYSAIGGNGWVGDLTTDLVWRPRQDWTLTAGPRVSFADTDFLRTYYGVDGTQGTATGLPIFTPRAGLRSYGAGSMLKYDWSRTWSTMGFVEVTRLAGSAADSPVITGRGTRDQIAVGVGLSYDFSIGRR